MVPQQQEPDPVRNLAVDDQGADPQQDSVHRQAVQCELKSFSFPSKMLILLFSLPPIHLLQIDIRLGQENRLAILTFPSHRDAAMARRSLIIHVSEFGQNTRLRWLKPNSYFH